MKNYNKFIQILASNGIPMGKSLEIIKESNERNAISLQDKDHERMNYMIINNLLNTYDSLFSIKENYNIN